jgi:hypothetical protein
MDFAVGLTTRRSSVPRSGLAWASGRPKHRAESIPWKFVGAHADMVSDSAPPVGDVAGGSALR